MFQGSRPGRHLILNNICVKGVSIVQKKSKGKKVLFHGIFFYLAPEANDYESLTEIGFSRISSKLTAVQTHQFQEQSWGCKAKGLLKTTTKHLRKETEYNLWKENEYNIELQKEVYQESRIVLVLVYCRDPSNRLARGGAIY